MFTLNPGNLGLYLPKILISTGIISNSLFRQCKTFDGELKSSESPNVQITFNAKQSKYKLTLTLNNIDEVIESEPNSFYIVTQGRPVLEQLIKWPIRTSYSVLLSQKEEKIFKILFPHFLVLKLSLNENHQKWRDYLSSVKIHLQNRQFITIDSKINPTSLTVLFDLPSITWDTKYYILVLLTNSLMSLSDLTQNVFNLFSNSPNAENILKELYFACKPFSIDLFLQYSTRKIHPKPVQPHYIAIKKVFATPTTFCFYPPESELSNRVMRKYSEFSEYFIRLNFCEENGEKRIWPKNSKVLLSFQSLLNSFSVFEYDFEFLGFSNSQMKNHSCWMVLKTLDTWGDSIRQDLGDFSSCLSVAKYACRLGLCFTSTYKTLHIPNENIKKIPDIERNGYIFSDGIGKISPEYLFQARNILNIPATEEISAIQIRLGGCKGVVALSPELENCIAIRPSMCKFISTDTTLEICSFARFRPAYLNRQIILLLHGLGVPDSIFLEMQQGMILSGKKALQDEKLAIQFIQQYNDQGAYSDLLAILEKNIKISEEIYLQMMLNQMYLGFISDIKERSRIYVPESALLMGVIDEYAILNYSQVYIRISGSGYSSIIEGPVVVTKNPCLHPGDIKILEAVNIPALSHLVNVIVFPQKGSRPHPNECSGSDLDGDEYFISWNQHLIPPHTCNPMEYLKAQEINEKIVNVDKVKEYFIRYMESGDLGTIANLHLIHADLKGIFSDEALILARLHSDAVDYAKTGKPVKVPFELKTQIWPDFMQKRFKPAYQSPGILGVLHRSIVQDEKLIICNYAVNNNLIVDGFEKFLLRASEIYSIYQQEMENLLRKTQLPHESHLLSAKSFSNKSASNTGKTMLSKRISQIKATALKMFLITPEKDRQKLASACYTVVRIGQKKIFYSFPWIFHQYLLK